VTLVPFVSFVMLTCFTLYWIITAVYLYSCGITTNDNSPFKKDRKWFFTFYAFGGFWIFCFLLSLNYFIVASTACIWYFTQDDYAYMKTR
jgi:hypothetical protein